jgi:hypothetical protein
MFYEDCFYGNPDDPYLDYDGSRLEFANPGSALRAGKRIHACPSCGQPNRLTAKDKALARLAKRKTL